MVVRFNKTAQPKYFYRPTELTLSAYNTTKKDGLEVPEKPKTTLEYLGFIVMFFVCMGLVIPFVMLVGSGEFEHLWTSIAYRKNEYEFALRHSELIKRSIDYKEYLSGYKLLHVPQ